MATLIGVLIAIAGPCTPVTAADPTVTRITMLPLAERTTIVVELTAPVSKVEEVQRDGTTVVLEAGPMAAGVQARDLTPAVTSPFVTAVTVRGTVRADGATYLRLRITTRAQAVHQRRTAGSRLYVDFMAPDARASRPPTESAATSPAPQPGTATADAGAPRRRQPLPEAEAKPPEPEAKRTEPGPPIDAAYRLLESSTLRQARELAARPDVKALLRLRDLVRQRDNELGNKRPELINSLTIELLKYTDQARALQLEQDRRSFVKEQQ